MKKLSIVLALVAMIAFASCGTSKDRCPSVEIEKVESSQTVNV